MGKEFIWQRDDWPKFAWSSALVLDELHASHQSRQQLFDLASSLDFESARNFQADMLTQEVIQNSAIEGEQLDHASVRSSVARHLGIDGLINPGSRQAVLATMILLDAVKLHASDLTAERLKGWHKALFPLEIAVLKHEGFIAGDWRDDSGGRMEVVSKYHGMDRVHLVAPPAKQVPAEMARFLAWFNASRGKMDGMLRAAVAHLWYITIHPFEDGNGRIARTITDLALAQDERSSQRFYSVSNQIMKEKTDYYDILEKTQRGDLDISGWLKWSARLMRRSIEDACNTIERVKFKAAFWEKHRPLSLNERQTKLLNKLLDAGDDFLGYLTTQKASKMTDSSLATASRDLSELEHLGILVKNPRGGRSTSYQIAYGLEQKLFRLARRYMRGSDNLAKARIELQAQSQRVSRETFRRMKHQVSSVEKGVNGLREDLQTTAAVLQQIHGEPALRHYLALFFGQDKAQSLVNELRPRPVEMERSR